MSMYFESENGQQRIVSPFKGVPQDAIRDMNAVVVSRLQDIAMVHGRPVFETEPLDAIVDSSLADGSSDQAATFSLAVSHPWGYAGLNMINPTRLDIGSHVHLVDEGTLQLRGEANVSASPTTDHSLRYFLCRNNSVYMNARFQFDTPDSSAWAVWQRLGLSFLVDPAVIPADTAKFVAQWEPVGVGQLQALADFIVDATKG